MQAPQHNLSVAMKTIGRPNMIRIETTADFDADGRFVLTGKVPTPVAPGRHRVTIVISDADVSRKSEATALQEGDDPLLQRINGVLVWSGQLLEGPEETRQRLDDERTEHLLRGFPE